MSHTGPPPVTSRTCVLSHIGLSPDSLDRARLGFGFANTIVFQEARVRLEHNYKLAAKRAHPNRSSAILLIEGPLGLTV